MRPDEQEDAFIDVLSICPREKPLLGGRVSQSGAVFLAQHMRDYATPKIRLQPVAAGPKAESTSVVTIVLVEHDSRIGTKFVDQFADVLE